MFPVKLGSTEVTPEMGWCGKCHADNVLVLRGTKKGHKAGWCSACWSVNYPFMSDAELGEELATIMREQKAAKRKKEGLEDMAWEVSDRKPKAVKKESWEDMTEEALDEEPKVGTPKAGNREKDKDDQGDCIIKLQREVAAAEESLLRKKAELSLAIQDKGNASPTKGWPWQRLCLPESPAVPSLQPGEERREPCQGASWDPGWVLAYHGTKYKYLGAILEEGLRDSFPSPDDHRSPGVYVTPVKETALGYAGEAQQTQPVYVVLECRVPPLWDQLHLWKKKDSKNKRNIQWLFKQQYVVVTAVIYVGWHALA